MTQETRKDRRVKIVSLNVRYKSATVDEFIDNHAHDVSRGGIYIKTANPFPSGTLLKFEIRLASDQAVIAGVGRVVWKRDAGHANGERPAGMGVKFIKIDEPSKAVIERLVSSKSDAGRAFESEPEAVASSEPPPVKTAGSIPPPRPSSDPPTSPRGNASLSRKGTMMGLGTPPSPSSPPPAQPGSESARPPAVSPSMAPPRPGPSPMFPRSDPAVEAAPKQEPTVMRQAAELLEEALREAGGSMEEIGTNPLFSGGGSPARPQPAAASPAPSPAPPRPAGSGAPPASAPSPSAGPAEPGPSAKQVPSAPSLTTRESPAAKVAVERDRTPSRRPVSPAAVAVDAAPTKKGGSTGLVTVAVAVAAVVAGVFLYRDRLFGGSSPPEPTRDVATQTAPPAKGPPSAPPAPADVPATPPSVATASAAAVAPSASAPSATSASAPSAIGSIGSAPSVGPARPVAVPPAPRPVAPPRPTPPAEATPPSTGTPPPAPAKPKGKPGKSTEENPYG